MDNVLYHGDNLDVLRRAVEDESVDLIYVDPPFNSNATYSVRRAEEGASPLAAFEDTWHWSRETEAAWGDMVDRGGPVSRAMQALRLLLDTGDMMAYLAMMAPRLVELHRVLRQAGNLYLHCDPTASHYLKVLLDAVFGAESFRNELIWYYGGRGAKAVARQFPRNHDVILVYSKKRGAQRYNRQLTQRSFSHSEARQRGFRQDEQGRWFKTAPRGDYTDDSIERLEAAGRIHRTRSGGIRVKYFLREEGDRVVEDVLVGDTWLDIPDAMHMGHEHLGYPTQKPQALLERIIRAGSDEGDTVLDPFCGCGTALSAAQALNRRWIGIDSSPLAVNLVQARLRDAFGEMLSYEVVGELQAVPVLGG